jgi:DUF177 domain-containing protein
MTTANPLRISVSDLLRRPGASRTVDVAGPVSDLGNGVADVPATEAVQFIGTLERISEGIVARGVVHATWGGLCSRCLQPLTGDLEIHVDELFETDPLEGETYALDDDQLDLQPLVRDTVALELPAVPLCADDCAGLCPNCGADRNATDCGCEVDDSDPRWAALRSLDL